jgi:hypothetical protein
MLWKEYVKTEVSTETEDGYAINIWSSQGGSFRWRVGSVGYGTDEGVAASIYDAKEQALKAAAVLREAHKPKTFDEVFVQLHDAWDVMEAAFHAVERTFKYERSLLAERLRASERPATAPKLEVWRADEGVDATKIP